ncbi:hypothetical protein AN641_00335 [Candidatus Epulonipiscioides gigas]|nr:hypothetical protein AN641_00335 [Epulopiscium sp. SCG-C07WGA-EpuloA2]
MEQNKITEGVIWKQVIWLFIPLVISAFFQHLYTFVDGMIIGKFLGATAFAAVGGSAAKIITLLINFFVGVSSGITSYTARFYGAKDNIGVKKVIFNGLIFFGVAGIALSILGIIFSNTMLELMGTPVETLLDANIYLKTFLVGLIFCIFYNTLSGVLRALGDTKTPLYVLIFTSFLNIALDLLFVIIFPMGVLGVALATLIAQGISAIALLIILIKKRLPKTEQIQLKIDFKIIREICGVGIPAGIQSIMYSISNILVQSAINGFGTTTVAAWSAYVKIDSIVDVFVSALGSTVITFVGQNYGAKQYARVKESIKQIILISYIITIVIMTGFILFRTQLLGLFTTEQAVVEIGKNLFFVIMPMYLLGIPQTMFIQALRGLGKSFIPMILTLIGVIGIRVIWVLIIFPLNPNIYFLGICYPVSSLIMSIIFTLYFYKESKKLIPTI